MDKDPFCLDSNVIEYTTYPVEEMDLALCQLRPS